MERLLVSPSAPGTPGCRAALVARRRGECGLPFTVCSRPRGGEELLSNPHVDIASAPRRMKMIEWGVASFRVLVGLPLAWGAKAHAGTCHGREMTAWEGESPLRPRGRGGQSRGVPAHRSTQAIPGGRTIEAKCTTPPASCGVVHFVKVNYRFTGSALWTAAVREQQPVVIQKRAIVAWCCVIEIHMCSYPCSSVPP